MATLLKFLRNGDGFVAIHSVAQSEDISADGIKSIRRTLKQKLFTDVVGSSLFTGEIWPKTCSLSTVELWGVATAVDGSDAPNWPKLRNEEVPEHRVLGPQP